MRTRVAMVGTGDWARHALAPALHELSGVEVVAAASPDSAQLAAFATDFGISRTYESIEPLLQGEPDLDLVVISTPDSEHAAGTTAALEAGIAVYCEKPLANSTADADELARLSDALERPATVGFSFRYSEAVQRLRADIVSGALGRPWLLELHEQNSQFHPVIGRPMTWKGDPAHAAGGALFEYGAHILDLGAWLLGPATEVTAAFAQVTAESRLDDIATLQLRYGDGILATAVASWVLTGGFPGIHLVLHGSAGRAEVHLDDSGPSSASYRRIDADGTVVEQLDYPAVPRHAYAARHLGDLLAALRGEQPHHPETLPTLGEAAHVQRILDAALRATTQRQPI